MNERDELAEWICGESYDHTERQIHKDEDGEQWECEECGAEWWHDADEIQSSPQESESHP